MKKMVFISALLVFITLMAGSTLAQDLVIYPAKGQTQEQMEKDKSECYGWAKQQTGFDPMQAQGQQQQAQQQQAANDQKLSAYNKAYSACLEGKGYTVK